ncbi:lysine--tRNA ligase [Kribbella sancticallisti]|uniref:Lysine--tRNA ligase n=1 Tax=Kribbella sancticallisti TaxID=460087 RepID=A0ABP4QTN5_9ACTN
MATRQRQDWVRQAAEAAIAHRVRPGVVTCASGISPSGPVHLGNLREILVPHFVAEEIRRMGVAVRHILSWDDFDRLRKVPAGLPPSFAEFIGRPLSKVPDPEGEFTSWAERFKAPLRHALADMGVEVVEISQTEMYESGRYRDQVLTAVQHRDTIEKILSRYRTKATADEDGPTPAGPFERFPYKLYCCSCGHDSTTIEAYDDETTVAEYSCSHCCYHGSAQLDTDHGAGKLVWKVDWPMRWAFEGVDFESAGVDHASPGSSFTVGTQMVQEVFGGVAPSFLGYSFVGVQGMAKMSGSAGRVPTPADALAVLEASIVRWLYARRKPNQSFTIDLGQEVVRLYDEWDGLVRKQKHERTEAQQAAYERASQTSLGRLRTPKVVVPFRILSSVADVTAGSIDQIARIVGDVGYPHESISDLQPRLDLASNWIQRHVDEGERTKVKEAPDTERLSNLTRSEQTWLDLLLARLDPKAGLGLDEVTRLVYGVPKLARNLELDAEPTAEIAADQKQFFRLLYELLVGRERGPRLPTLFLAIGLQRVRYLLIPDERREGTG